MDPMGAAGESTPRLLVVEDDELLGETLRRALINHGYAAERVATGTHAVEAAGDAHLVLLDLGLPDLDGVEVCRRICGHVVHPSVIVLTARASEVDVVMALDAGAVDYVVKPYRLAELLARIRAHLRDLPEQLDRFDIGPLMVDAAARRVWLNHVEVDLRAKEFEVLLLLSEEAGRVVTRDRLMSEVWDSNWHGSTKTLDVTMANLRRKLNEASRDLVVITGLRGIGYRLERPPTVARSGS